MFCDQCGQRVDPADEGTGVRTVAPLSLLSPPWSRHTYQPGRPTQRSCPGNARSATLLTAIHAAAEASFPRRPGPRSVRPQPDRHHHRHHRCLVRGAVHPADGRLRRHHRWHSRAGERHLRRARHAGPDGPGLGWGIALPIKAGELLPNGRVQIGGIVGAILGALNGAWELAWRAGSGPGKRCTRGSTVAGSVGGRSDGRRGAVRRAAMGRRGRRH